MNNGSFIASGTPDELKKDHGQFYVLELELFEGSEWDEIDAEITGTLHFCELLTDVKIEPITVLTYQFNDFHGFSNFNFINRESEGEKLRKQADFILKFIQSLIDEGKIRDFSLYMTSLEMIFKKLIISGDKSSKERLTTVN